MMGKTIEETKKIEVLVGKIKDSSNHDSFLNELSTFYQEKTEEEKSAFNKLLADAFLAAPSEKTFEILKKLSQNDLFNEELGKSDEIFEALNAAAEKS